MVYDITLIYQQTVCFFTADLPSCFRSKLQSVAVMASSRKCLLEDETVQSLLEELTASDQSSSSDDDDSSETDDFTVGEVFQNIATMCNVPLHPVRLVLHLRGRT